MHCSVFVALSHFYLKIGQTITLALVLNAAKTFDGEPGPAEGETTFL